MLLYNIYIYIFFLFIYYNAKLSHIISINLQVHTCSDTAVKQLQHRHCRLKNCMHTILTWNQHRSNRSIFPRWLQYQNEPNDWLIDWPYGDWLMQWPRSWGQADLSNWQARPTAHNNVLNPRYRSSHTLWLQLDLALTDHIGNLCRPDSPEPIHSARGSLWSTVDSMTNRLDQAT